MSDVPVISGDDRVACQHCYARVAFTGGEPTAAWIDQDAKNAADILFCAPGLLHAPMPKIMVR